MEEDSSNGAGADKRNWRERLGIGAKELPKLSDEFRDEQSAGSAAPAAGTARPAPRAPQPVTKPAPMAPRAQPKPAEPAAEAPAAAPSAPMSRATPKAPDNAAQDALAEKLRAQRAAAERLAEQRVQAARTRAENRPKVEPAAPRPTAPPPPPARPAAPTSRASGLTPPGAPPRPKFSFADDSRSEAPLRPGRGGPAAPLTPPRPSLGGDRGQPPFLRPGSGASSGSLGARPQPAFRPTNLDNGSSYGSQPRLQAPGASRAGLGADPAAYGTTRLPARRPPPLDPYARQPQPEPRDYPEDDYEDDVRPAPRLGRPGVGARGRAAQDDFDEVFEEDQAPRGRAAGRDYQSGYAEGEDGFADEPRRSSGPWLLLLALLAAAVLTGAVVWFYSDNVKNLTGVGSSSSSGTTPVVPAPEDPAKVAAPDAAGGDGQTQTPSARKKQIYDRIVGEQEVTGEVQPTEEMPVAPEAAQPAAVDQVPKIEPGSGNAIPAPDAANQGTTGLPADPSEPPAPLPIPGSGDQGKLDLKGGQQVAAASAQPDQGSTAPPPPSPAQQASSSDTNIPPPPEKSTDGAALVSGGGSTASSALGTGQIADDAGSMNAKPDAQDAGTPPAKPAKKPATAATKKKPPAKKTPPKQPDYDNLGTAPVVLVPPSKQAAAQSQTTAVAPAPEATAPAAAGQPPANAQKRKSIFDLFNGADANQAAPAAPPTQVASSATQTKQAPPPPAQPKAVAPAQPKTAAPATPPAATSSGYVIQLASFRTDTDAKTEYSRLARAYPSIVGPLKSQIRQTSIGGSTRYQLGLGPLPTRGDATRICGELIAAGESDCIVRGP